MRRLTFISVALASLLAVVFVLAHGLRAEALGFLTSQPFVAPQSATSVNLSWTIDAISNNEARYTTASATQVQQGGSGVPTSPTDPVNDQMMDAFAVTSQTAYLAIRNNGTSVSRIIETHDGGATWSTVIPDIGTKIGIPGYGVLTVTATKDYLWFGGSGTGKVFRYRISDGSVTNVDLSSTFVNIWDLAAAAEKVWAVGRNVGASAIASIDAATNAATVYNPSVPAWQYTTVTATDATHVAAAGLGARWMFYTTNGGTSWTSVDLGSGVAATSILAIGPDEFVIAAVFDGVYHIKGTTATNPIGAGPYSSYFALRREGLTTVRVFNCCNVGPSGVTSAISTDNGVTFGPLQYASLGVDVTEGAFRPDGQGWLVGANGRIYRYGYPYSAVTSATQTSFTTYTAALTGLQSGATYHADAIATKTLPETADTGDFTFMTQALAFNSGPSATPTSNSVSVDWGTNQSTDSRVYVSTTSNGWEMKAASPSNILDIDGDGDHAVVFTLGPTSAYYTDDLGRTWSASTGLPPNTRFKGDMRGRLGSAVADHVIGRTTDGGATWTTQSSPYYLESVTMVSPQVAFAVGESLVANAGVIIRTTDGGSSWQLAYQTDGLYILDLAVVNSTIIAVGAGGWMFRSTDGGATFTPAHVGSVVGFYNISMYDANNGWISGVTSSAGWSMRTTDGGQTWTNYGFASCGGFPQPNDLTMVAPDEVWFVGASGYIRSFKVGSGSCPVQQTTGLGGVNINGIDFDGNSIWVGASSGSTARRGLTTTIPGVTNGTLAQTHSLSVGGLTPGTSYSYFVQSYDAAGNTIYSPIGSFMTNSLPELTVFPNTFTFTAQQGGANPTPQIFSVFDAHNGAVNLGPWTMTSDQPWLTTSFANGSLAATPADVNLDLNVAGLTAGSYTGHVTVTVTDPSVLNRTQVVTVTLNVTAPPNLSVTPTTPITFTAQQGGALPAPVSISVANTQAGTTLNYTVTKVGGSTWLNVTPPCNPTTCLAPSTFSLQPSTTATAGTFTETVRVAGQAGTLNSPQTISVTYTVQPPPLLQTNPVAPATFTFSAQQGGPNPPAQTLTVQNAGGGTMAWTVSKTPAIGSDWLTWTCSPGACDGNGPTTVSLQPVTALAAPGSYTAQLTINAGTAGSATFTVTFTVQSAPVLSVSPTSIAFPDTQQYTIPPNQNFRVTSGAEAWEATVTQGGSWLSLIASTPGNLLSNGGFEQWSGTPEKPNAWSAGNVIKTTAVPSGASGSLAVVADGTQPAALPVQSDVAQDVGVTSTLVHTYRVTGWVRHLNVSQTTALDGGGLITQCWTGSHVGTWVDCPTGTGYDLYGSAPGLVSGKAAGYDSGWFFVDFTVSNNTGNNVGLRINCFSRAKTQTYCDDVVVTELTSGTGTAIVTGNGPYPTALIGVHADPIAANLVPNPSPSTPYQGTIHLRNTGSTATLPASLDIPVTILITPPPVLIVSPLTLNFSGTEGGANPPAQQVAIQNAGIGSLNWTINQPTAAWLRLSTAGCTGTYQASITGSVAASASQSIDACVDIAGLTAVGSPYATSFVVSAPGASGTPKTVNVTLTVSADTVPPVIDPAQVSLLTTFDCSVNPPSIVATLQWQTDEASDSQVEWGQTTNASGVPIYDNSLLRDPVDVTAHAGGVTTHSVLIDHDGANPLVGGHRYYLRFRSRDRYNNQSAWYDHNPPGGSTWFSYVAPTACDNQPPTSVSLTLPSATLTGTVSIVLNATDASGISKFELYYVGSGVPAPVLVETINVAPGDCTLSGTAYTCAIVRSVNSALVPDGIWNVYIKAYDTVGPPANNASSTPTTPLNGLGVLFVNSGPQVSNVSCGEPDCPVKDGSGVWTATIHWQTDKPSDAKVRFGLQNADGTYTYSWTVTGDDAACSGNLNHCVTLPRLAPPLLNGRIYHYQVESCLLDGAGNSTVLCTVN